MKTVPLYGKKAAGRVALVDDADYELVMRHRWHVWERPNRRSPTGRREGPYAATGARLPDGRQTKIYMHILITGGPKADHKDHDGLNNQRSNLRVVTDGQNSWNQRKSRSYAGRPTRSPYKGVHWGGSRWVASITANYKTRRLGTFRTQEEAARAYNAAATATFGEFAQLNDLPKISGRTDPP